MYKRVKKYVKKLKESENKYIIDTYRFLGNNKDVSTNIVVIDKLKFGEKIKSNDKNRFFSYITNIPINNERTAYQLSVDFRKRWAQETNFRVKNAFRIPTCSLFYNTIFLLIMVSHIMYNIWRFVNAKFKEDNLFAMTFGGHITAPHLCMELSFFILRQLCVETTSKS
ncbi:MAG: hypothetical protein AB1779_08210 [Candidatus Thermoplasmatota archaeon]